MRFRLLTFEFELKRQLDSVENEVHLLSEDLLLYRDNFPIIASLAGSQVYFAEVVLATIEVKSLLTGDEIGRATENIRSVTLETGEDGLVDHEPVERR